MTTAGACVTLLGDETLSGELLDSEDLLVEDWPAAFVLDLDDPLGLPLFTGGAGSSSSSELIDTSGFGLDLVEPFGLPLFTGGAGSSSSSEHINTSGSGLDLVEPFGLPRFVGCAGWSSLSELSTTLIAAAFLFAGT